MKKLTRFLLAAVLLLSCGLSQAVAQQMPPIPVDPNVRIGTLPNGLTYYIRHNALPENRADFYIAQKVGSIQEELDQLGLAHFLEHMCFNGTTNFPGNKVISYLESIGVKFGVNLNAYTSIDETVYNISNVPVTTPGAIDSCLLILHDWSNDLSLEEQEIDKERGVINEEWRTSMTAGQRLMERSLPQMYPGTKYATCFPIGTMDVVMNFPYQTLRDYYETWYRPDLQGIVVVGDINVDEIEAKIKTMFSDIPAQPEAKERIYYPVPDNKEPIIVIEQDKEQPYVQALFYSKHAATPNSEKGNLGYLVEDYAKDMITTMLNTRLAELAQLPNPPFIYAGTQDANFFVAKTVDALFGIAVCQENNIEGGISALVTEIERAREFGFTESEYARARAEYLRNLESAYNERDKVKNEPYAQQYVRHFLDNEPIPGIENEYAIISQIAPNIPVAALNQMIQVMVTDSNQVLTVFAPEKEGLVLPTKAALAELITSINKEELTPYVDTASDEPLMAEKPKGGKIVSEKALPMFGATELTLSNGVKVILKDTDFKADQILMKGVSFGGSSLFPNEEVINFKSLDAISVGGLGNFSAIDLDKALAGKKASVNFFIGDKTEGVNANCSPQDLETMLQLTYLTFTAPRRDEDAFASYKNRTKASLQNLELNPRVALNDSIQTAIYENHPRAVRLTADMIDQIDYDKLMEMYMNRFEDASDFTFIMVGNIDIEKDKELIAEYLGALPVTNRKETFKDNKMNIRKGIYTNEFTRQQENPKTTNVVFYSGSCPFTEKNNIMMSMTYQILNLIYTEKVREDEGGTYGVGVYGSVVKYTKPQFIFQIQFDTAPSKSDKLMEIIYAEIDQLAKDGPSIENLNKVKEYMLKKYSEDLKENRYWMNSIDEYIYTGVDLMANYEQMVNSITVKDIQKFAHMLFSQKNRIKIGMTSPEE